MHSSVELDLTSFLISCLLHLDPVLFPDDLEVCIYFMIILYPELFIFNHQFVDELRASHLLRFNHFEKLGKFNIVVGFLLDILVMNGFKQVCMLSKATDEAQLFHNNESFLNVQDVVFLVKDLNALMAQFHQNVVEHNFLHSIVGRDVEGSDLPLTEGLVFDRLPPEGDQCSTLIFITFGQVD